MARHVSGDGWSLLLPDGVDGGALEHTHRHLRTMALYRGLADDGSDLEVIVTTYPGEPIGEHGERLDRGGEPRTVPGARAATRRHQVTRLDYDPAVAPVETIIIVAIRRGEGSVCLVVHRPIGSPTTPSESVVDSFALEGA